MPKYLVKQKVVQWNVSEVEADCLTDAVWITSSNPPSSWAAEKKSEPTEIIITLIEEKK